MKKNTKIVGASILLALVGIYLLAAGLKNTNALDFLSVVQSSIFWGLFHLMTGVYVLIRFVKK